jgi:hypothetical protein
MKTAQAIKLCLKYHEANSKKIHRLIINLSYPNCELNKVSDTKAIRWTENLHG